MLQTALSGFLLRPAKYDANIGVFFLNANKKSFIYVFDVNN